MKASSLPVGIALVCLLGPILRAQSPYTSSAEFERYARKLRESALLTLEPRVEIPTQASPLLTSERYPWKRLIITTVFWVGELAGQNNPVDNISSSWDVAWSRTYGGYDSPEPSARAADFRPAKFIPQLNPFYFALPYNDVENGHHKPEARSCIPWFKEAFVEDGKSVLKDRWICIKNRFGKECYAQWGDCGPFRTDHWQYVFGPEKPKLNLNKGAGLDVSPAVRDYLGLQGTDVTDWKFVEWREVPPGPWRRYGELNNQWVRYSRSQDRLVRADASQPSRTVITPANPATARGPRVEISTSR
jgi:hypothetical protein